MSSVANKVGFAMAGEDATSQGIENVEWDGAFCVYGIMPICKTYICNYTYKYIHYITHLSEIKMKDD